MVKTLAVLLFLWSSFSFATVGPQPIPQAPTIKAPSDIEFRGAITLSVDASDKVHKIFRVLEIIPVQKAGRLVLLYPEWETGSHSPTQEVAPLAGLIITAGTHQLEWQRHPSNPFAFQLNVPANVKQIELEFQVLPSLFGPQLISPDMLMLPWQKFVIYPAGWFIRNIAVEPSLTIPVGFKFATSLETVAVDDNRIVFSQVSLEDLVDSPVYAGNHFKRIELTQPPAIPIRLNVFGDNAESLSLPADVLTQFREITTLIPKLFRSEHYRHFDFLMSMSDVLQSGGGYEHQESTEINVSASYASNPGEQMFMSSLIIHEFAHSWNGRTRQPADLWQPNLNMPIGGSLLWVYEGQTEFWAYVMPPRTGMRTVQQSMDALALNASIMNVRSGRRWKSLHDSNIDAVYMPGKSVDWRDWQRREDYYREGVLLWLDVDMLLRELTSDKKSLQDFAATFFGGGENSRAISTYTFADICKALNKLAPYNWADYFEKRLNTHDSAHLLDGLERSGYRLVYTNKPTDFFIQHEQDLGGTDLSTSLGLVVSSKGSVKSVMWEGPAFKVGISIGAKFVSINKQAYTDVLLKREIASAATSKKEIEVEFEADGIRKKVVIPYFGGLRYPQLERIPESVDRLTQLLTSPL